MSETRSGGSEVSREPLLRQLRSFGYVYWVANWIELVERFAWCGVRVIAPVFIVAAFEEGGPELNQIQKGEIFAVWAVIQSFVPILSGGFADRFGYKINIACSVALTVLGYLVMGHSVVAAQWWAGMGLREARSLGIDHAYAFFFIGASLVGFGTAIFKPGLQGLLANRIPQSAASRGWGMFYQVVNIGGGFGPLLAGPLHKNWGWNSVFYVCAAALSLNLIPLFFFREPRRPHDPNRVSNPFILLYRAVQGLLDPRLFFFTVSFAGFWLMYFQLFDVLPNFINDWIDSRSPARALQSVLGTTVMSHVVTEDGNLPQEWIIFVNFFLISVLAFAVSYFTGRMRSLPAIVIGIAMAAAATCALGFTMNGWWTILAIAVFSFGEMMASPTQMRYLSGIAPANKKGQFMGYAGFSVGMGWSIGSIVGGHLYENLGDKVVLARNYLVEHEGMARRTVDAIAKNDLLPFFQKRLGIDAWETRRLLWETYEPYWMWLIFALIGLGAMAALVVYDRAVRAADARPAHPMNTHGRRWTGALLFPITLALAGATYYQWRVLETPAPGLSLVTGFFVLMAVVSFVRSGDEDTTTEDR